MEEQSREKLIENAVQILWRERGVVLALVRGNEDMAEEIIGRVGLILADPTKKVDFSAFINLPAYRRTIYKSLRVDLLRSRSKETKRISPRERDDTLDLHPASNLEIQTFETQFDFLRALDTLITDIEKRGRGRGLTVKETAKARVIVEMKSQGVKSKNIALKLGLDESRISQLISQYKKCFPEYKEFWQTLLAREDDEKKEEKIRERRFLYRERIERSLQVLGEQKFYDKNTQGAIILGRWYLEDGQDEEKLNEQLKQVGVNPFKRNLTLLRDIIRTAAGAPIDFYNVIIRTRKIKFQ